ncbi:MAG: hypothetical protein M3680_36250 [Myxococcota bacterium]|nr:hypothetical protein [Myxococcota bacterium]
MHAVILERNKLVGRKIARLFMASGATAAAVDDPAQVAGAIAGADVLCADTFDGELVAEQVRAQPGLRGLLWTAEPLRRSLRYLVETAGIDHVFGRRDFESVPRAWELLMVARRLVIPCAPPALPAYLDWGFTALELEVRTTADRDVAVGRLQDLVAGLGLPRRLAETCGELAHELIMNAMYDAPVDAAGRPKYAGDRKSAIVLEAGERPTVRAGTDGSHLVLQVRDPFGRLERTHVVDGLARGLDAQGAQLDTSHGGAGLGMMMCHNAASALFFDVARGQHTEVTAVLELDLNQRELRTQARSLHYFSRPS